MRAALLARLVCGAAIAAWVGLFALGALAQKDDPLVGVWRGQFTTQFGPMQAELILMADGSYTSAAYTAGTMTRHWGHWRTFPGTLRLDIEGAEPRQWCGPLGCNPIHWPDGETWQYDMPDCNTLRTAGGTLQRAQ